MFPGTGVSKNRLDREKPIQTSDHSGLPSEFEYPSPWRITPGRWLLPLILWSVIFSSEFCRGQDVVEAEEYRAKAALLYKFCKFVTWPENPPANKEPVFVFSVVGKTPLLRALQAIDGKKIGGKPIKTLPVSNAKDVGLCRVMFCSTEELKNLSPQELIRLADSHVLTIGETDGFLNAGGIMALSVVQEHLTFTVNLGAARRAKLEMSAALLSLAEEIVYK